MPTVHRFIQLFYCQDQNKTLRTWPVMQLLKHRLNPNTQRKHAMALCLQLLQHSQLANYIHIYFIVFLCFIIYQKNLISFSIDCINVSGKALSTKGYFRQEKRLPKVSPRSKSPFIINYGFLIQIGKLFKKFWISMGRGVGA